VWPGDWGLPSVDHQCLAAMAYFKFCRLPARITKVSNSWSCLSGQFPILQHFDGVENKVKDIFNFLQKQSLGLDGDLSVLQRSDGLAFSTMIEEKLLPALLYLWWIDSKAYVEFTRPWYAKILPFPLGLYVPLKKRNVCLARLQACYGEDIDLVDSTHESKILREAKECLNLLSTKLGDKPFFFGSKPSSLDALVFGYIAPLLKAPLPNAALQQHLKGCKNLAQFSARILDEHFPLTPQEREALRAREEDARLKMNDVSEYPHKRRNMLIAGVVVLASMVGYALLTGLVQIDLVDAERGGVETSRARPRMPRGDDKGDASAE